MSRNILHTAMTEKIMIREGRSEELDEIMEVYRKAIAFMRSKGNKHQWVNGYPAKEDILEDMKKGHNFVGVDSDGEIVVSFAYILGNDPTYEIIEGGSWLNDEEYGTIHRIATSGKYSRMMEQCIDFCSRFSNNIRIDTHRDNRPMLEALNRLGFVRCGIIYCRDGSPRIAFQKVFEK